MPHQIMLTMWHPNTFLFLEIVKEICIILKIHIFDTEKYNTFLKDNNYMKLP